MLKDLQHDVPETWCFSTGVSEITEKQTGKIVHSMMFALYSREGASSQQRKWYLDFKEKITKTCKEAILKVKNSIERSTLTGNEELFMNGYFDYVRPPSGDEKVGPTLSVKLAKSYYRIYSKFFKWDERVPTNGGRIQFVNIIHSINSSLL